MISILSSCTEALGGSLDDIQSSRPDATLALVGAAPRLLERGPILHLARGSPSCAPDNTTASSSATPM